MKEIVDMSASRESLLVRDELMFVKTSTCRSLR